VYVSPHRPAPNVSLLNLGEGPQVIDHLVAQLQKFKRDPVELAAVRKVALDLVTDVAPHDDLGEIRRVWEYVRDGIRYVRDVANVDTLQGPRATLRILQGDCDDKAVLLAALLETIGFSTRFVVSATIPRHSYNHVYVETFVPKLGTWIPLETSIAGFPFGKALPTVEPLRRFA
jgi:transglutaminase-like putative cysteine protease